MRELNSLKADFDSAKQMVIEASKKIFELEKQIQEMGKEAPEGLSMFIPVAPGQPKEKHHVVFIDDQEETEGSKKILEVQISEGSLEKPALGQWIKEHQGGYLFAHTLPVVMSNGNIYKDCWVLSLDKDGLGVTLKMSYSSIQ